MNLKQTYLSLDHVFYTPMGPVPFDSVSTFVWNQELAESMGLNEDTLQQDFMPILQGISPSHRYYAQAYAGHQYGHFTMLGDGRAVVVGEWKYEGQLVDLQLKGSGPTPYSRRGDGRATLQSMLREYLISEAMFHLGVPTTRSLAVYKTEETVVRERQHQGAMLLRVAASHIRVGTIEYARGLNNVEALRELVDYAIHRHYPEMVVHPNRYLGFFEQVVMGQAKLIATWQSLGFVHGVMNTDNMTISGETIDYGPCAFLDEYKPKMSFSSIDQYGRYAFFRQPYIASWNLSKLAVSLLPLIDENETVGIQKLNQVLDQFEMYYSEAYLQAFAHKLGLSNPISTDQELIEDLLSMMDIHQADFTNTFYDLTMGSYENLPFSKMEWIPWFERWSKRILEEVGEEQAKRLMRQSNPVIIPRNHLVQQAVDQADFDNDDTLFQTLLRLVQSPYDYETSIPESFRQGNPSAQRFVSYCGT